MPDSSTPPTPEEWAQVTKELRDQQTRLQLSEARYQSLLAVFDSVLMYANGSIVYANPAAVRLFGATDAAELLGRPVLDVAHPEYHRDMQTWMARAERGENVGLMEQKMIRLDGTTLVTEATSVPLVFDAQPAMQLVIRDITDRKQNERRLQEIEAKFRGIFESNVVGIIFWNADGHITDANDTFLTMTGYTRQELDAGDVDWRKMTPPQYAALDQQVIQQLAEQGKHPPFEKEYIRKDGTLLPVQVAGALFGNRTGGIAFVTDSTEHKRNEARLLASEAKFRRLFDSNMIGIVLSDSDGELREANDAFLALIGATRDELRAGQLNWNDITAPDFIAKSLESLEKMKLEGAFAPFEKEYIHKNGKRIPVITGGTRFEADQCLSFVLDTTDLKKAQRDLEDHARELAQSNAELEQFAYIASHDLQEPLRTMSGFAKLLSKKYQGRLDQDADEFIGFITDAADRMKKLINNLLEYSRVTSRNSPHAPTDLNAVVSRVTDNLRSRIKSTKARIRTSHLPEMTANEQQLTQLFQNLLSNALKFRDAKPLVIVIAARELTNAWEFSVSDTGIGIEMAYADRIFQVFQRLHSREAYEGTGIGLAICRKIVEQHGGRIWVESEPGKGSTFYFTLRK